ncbi:MAG: YlxR family protein [Desulfovibrionaceae bacterium]|nr:YlxR family protein [Desulfovibrionaceae bacterium]
MCCICRGRFPKETLLRHVCPGDAGAGAPGGLVPDPEGRLPGRGFYVCGDADCRRRFEKYSGWRRKCKGVRL